MLKKIYTTLKDIIKEDYKFIICLLLIYILLQIPLNYYIVVGGGTSDVSSRIKVEDKYKSKGSFNISYVTELKGTVITYLLSYIIPTWEREDVGSYKYNDKESIEDIEFRSDLDLKTANGTASYWAYTLAEKPIEEVSSNLYIITIFDGFKSDLKVGDQVLSIDNHNYDTVDGYRNYMQTKKENDYVEVRVLRKNKEKIIKSKLYKKDNRLILGVALQFVKEYKTNPEVKIKFKSQESGPSGGLITTLEIYNQLTKKDLTKGKTIVGTGTIEVDGKVGEIGGIEHKLLGAESAKADIFLVPTGKNYKDALKYKKSKKLKIKLIEVKNIKDAIGKLEKLK